MSIIKRAHNFIFEYILNNDAVYHIYPSIYSESNVSNKNIICIHIDRTEYMYLLKNINQLSVLANKLAAYANSEKLVILFAYDNLSVAELYENLGRLFITCKYTIFSKSFEYTIIRNGSVDSIFYNNPIKSINLYRFYYIIKNKLEEAMHNV